MPGSCSFEEMLSAVADFKAPVSEPGGSMQQGMYTPKGEQPLLLTLYLVNYASLFCFIINSWVVQVKALERDNKRGQNYTEHIYILYMH